MGYLLTAEQSVSVRYSHIVSKFRSLPRWTASGWRKSRCTYFIHCLCIVWASLIRGKSVASAKRVVPYILFLNDRSVPRWLLDLPSVYYMGIHDSWQVRRQCYKSGPYVHAYRMRATLSLVNNASTTFSGGY